MAKGNASGSGAKVSLKLEWESVKGNGGSTVYATLRAENESNWHFQAVVNQGYTLTINGNSKHGSTARLSSADGGTAILLQHSVWVPYTGDKSIKIEGNANMSNILGIGWRYVSCTATLDKIGSRPPVAKCTAPAAGVVSENTNSITVSWNVSNDYTGNAHYNIYMSHNGGAATRVKSGLSHWTTSCTIPITPAQDNTYSFAVEAANDIGGSDWSWSGEVRTNAIFPPAIGEIGTVNPFLGTPWISLTGGWQRNNEAVKRMIALFHNGKWLWEVNPNDVAWWNGGVSLRYTPEQFLGKLGVSSCTGTFRILAWCENSRGTRSNYVGKDFWVNINTDGGANPIMKPPVISGGILGYPTSCFIHGGSINVSALTPTLRRAPAGTTVTYKLEVIGVGTDVLNKMSGTFKLVEGVKTVRVTATDSRGLSASSEVKIRCQSYSPPTISNLRAERLQNIPTSAQLTYNLTYSPVYAYNAGVDTAGAQLNGIKTQTYNIGSGEVSCTSGATITGLNQDNRYHISVKAIDNIGNSTTETNTIPTAKVNLALRPQGIGINCIPDPDKALTVNGGAVVRGGLACSGIFFNSGEYCHTVHGQGKFAYTKIARINVVREYFDFPIFIEYVCRGMEKAQTIIIRFHGEPNRDPSLRIFNSTSGAETKLFKVGAGTWDIYVKKWGTYDAPCILSVKTNFGYMGGCVQFMTEETDTVPEGAISATKI